MLLTHKNKNISHLVKKIIWSGSRLQVARKLVFEYVQDKRDSNLPVLVINLGETIRGYDEEKNLIFRGNVYAVEKDVQASKITVTAYDNLFILSKSKTTKKFVKMLPADIVKAVCKEMGVGVGTLANPGVPVSFIAHQKTGYQIIMMAYTEAKKKTGKKYHPIMLDNKLHIIEKGTLIEGYEADHAKNTKNSQYKESIENMVNQVLITDEQGNKKGLEKKKEWIEKYSMIQDVYRTSPKENTQENVKNMFKGPERSGVLELLGDYRVKTPYSLKVKDSLFTGKFWIKSDSHVFENGIHEMKLELEFENLMNEEKISDSEKIKADKKKKVKSDDKNTKR